MRAGIVGHWNASRATKQAHASLKQVREKLQMTKCYVHLMPDFDRALVSTKIDAIDTLIDDVERLLEHEHNLFTQTGNQKAAIGA
jgi:ElaB/YqjD/DUF883 family membrane-anchored ribosome-binding protein